MAFSPDPEIITPLQFVGVAIILLIIVITFLGYNPFGLTEPLLVGPLVGMVLGIPLEVSLPLSALLELVYLGVFPIGGAAAPNAVLATISSLMFAKILGYTSVTSAELGALMSIAIPIGLLAASIEVVLARAGAVIYSHWADREIEKGNIGRLGLISFIGTFQWFIAYLIPLIAIAALGVSPAAVETIRASLESPVFKVIFPALGVGAVLLPAVGLGYLLKLTWSPEALPWFILGFVLVAYLKMPILGLTLIIISLILLVYWREIREAFSSIEASPASQRSGTGLISRSDLLKSYLKVTFAGQWAWNYERMQGTAYAFTMSHIEKKLRKDPEELKKWMSVHNEFYNTNPIMTPAILGMNIALEEGGADMETIRSLKTSLMGPLAGLGDGLFWFTWRPIVFGLGAGLVLTAGLLGVLASFILWTPVVLAVGWFFLRFGYERGLGMVSLLRAGRIDIVRKIAAMLAVAIVAALGATFINVHIPLTISPPGAQSPISIQSAIDSIMPKLIPLIFLLGAFYLYRRGFSILKVLAIYFILGFVLGLLGVLATG
ncbi:MAG TPA: PTS system mannose/fructose/sorbose family transporter subunit IID [Sulfolobales archaeon]|nr:PTS system mannose/fructose/sorbose family transporter subunit IID [Sulfolobales archaeon]